MNKLVTGCVAVWLAVVVCSPAQEETVACDVKTMTEVLKRLDAIEKKLENIDDRFGKYLPKNESVFRIYEDVRELKNDLREMDRSLDRVSTDMRRLESRR